MNARVEALAPSAARPVPSPTEANNQAGSFLPGVSPNQLPVVSLVCIKYPKLVLTLF